MNIFTMLEKINQKPKAYASYTTPELWCDPYISKQMLSYHLGEDTDLASRKVSFIDKSVEWISNYFKLGEQSRVCDFGCGPGLYTTKFAKKGAIVTGIDFSENSIKYAIDQAQKNNLEIKYVLQDYLKFETDDRFDLITMIYWDFCVLNPVQRALLLKKFHRLLKPDGCILLDVNSLVKFATRQETRGCEYSKQDGFWSKDAHYTFHNVFKYDEECLVLDKFSIIEASRTRENYNWHQCYSIESISAELRQNGFEIVEYFANVAGDQYHEDAPEIAIIAKKLH